MVADIDMGEDSAGNAHDGWASIIDAGLEETLDSFNYQTRRGGDHFIFAAPEGVRLGPTKNHATPSGEVLDSVDRRGGSSYSIWWSDEIPASREAFKPAPEWLLTPAAEVTLAPFGGGVDEWLAKCNQGEPEGYVREIVASIPATDFGHDVMVQLTATLVGLGADHRAGIPWALGRLRAEWLRDPYNTPEFARDYNLSLAGAIEKFGRFSVPLFPVAPVVPATPEPVAPVEEFDYVSAAMRVPGEDFFQAWIGIPEDDSAAGLADRVRWIRDIAIDRGLTREEAAAVAWNAAARKHANCTIATIEEVNLLEIELPEPPAAVEPADPLDPKRPVRLLTAREEEVLSRTTWWGDEFMQRMSEINPIMSEPYYRVNRWIILSLAFANHAIIPDNNGTDHLLNFYVAVLGPSGTGKSQSLNPVKGFMKAHFLGDDTPDIGGNATEAGLLRALHARDGKTSFFHSDEADAVLLAWSDKNNNAFAGMKQRMTDVFYGDVGPAQRSTAPELNKHSKAYLCAHLTGIDEKIIDAIEPDDWITGFANRLIWAKGERKHKSRVQKQVRLRQKGQGVKGGAAAWYQQWSADFTTTINTTLLTPDGSPAWMEFDPEITEDRHVDTKEQFERIAAASAHPERLRPTFERMEWAILKCAALVALSDRRKSVNMTDYLIALEQTEEWVATLLEMVEATDESPRSRQANKLAELIRRNGGLMASGQIHSQKGYAGNERDTNGLINELVAQGRVEILPVAKSPAAAIVRLVTEDGRQAA